jgi:uncharacterized protein (DUF952 family)
MLLDFLRSFSMRLVYKIIAARIWGQACAAKLFAGAAIDVSDGYIHLSDESQVETTARLYFAGQQNLVLVAFDPTVFGESLKWEASRGGALFPHVYGVFDPVLALWAKPLPWNGQSHDFPEVWKS